jgi:hypothetical protein
MTAWEAAAAAQGGVAGALAEGAPARLPDDGSRCPCLAGGGPVHHPGAAARRGLPAGPGAVQPSAAARQLWQRHGAAERHPHRGAGQPQQGARHAQPGACLGGGRMAASARLLGRVCLCACSMPGWPSAAITRAVPQALQRCHVEALPAGSVTLAPRETCKVSLSFRWAAGASQQGGCMHVPQHPMPQLASASTLCPGMHYVGKPPRCPPCPTAGPPAARAPSASRCSWTSAACPPRSSPSPAPASAPSCTSPRTASPLGRWCWAPPPSSGCAPAPAHHPGPNAALGRIACRAAGGQQSDVLPVASRCR